MKNKDIVVVGLQPYDSLIGSNCINIADEFAKQNRVLYVNYAFDRASIEREKNLPNVKKRINIMKSGADNLVQVNPNLYTLYPNTILESINWIPFTFLFRIANFINNKRFAKEIKKAIKTITNNLKHLKIIIKANYFISLLQSFNIVDAYIPGVSEA